MTKLIWPPVLIKIGPFQRDRAFFMIKDLVPKCGFWVQSYNRKKVAS